MSNFFFKGSCAMIVAIVFLFVFICSPCEGDEKEHHVDTKGNSPSSVNGHSESGDWAVPAGGENFKTELIILGVLVVGLVVYLIVKPAKDANAAKLASLDSVLTTPSSLLPWTADSLATFKVRLNNGSEKTIIDGKVTVIYEHDSWRSKLSFKNIIGVARDLDGPFEQTSLEIEEQDVFYVQLKNLMVYRVRVVQNRDGAELTFDET